MAACADQATLYARGARLASALVRSSSGFATSSMPRKFPSVLAAFVSMAAVSQAQCLVTAGATPVTLTPTGTFYPADDEGLSAPLPLGFAFPMGAATYTHVVIESNGVAYLTNGGPAVGATGFGFIDFPGFSGDSPRIAAFWTDLEGANAGTAWRVSVDSSVPGTFKINWENVNEYQEPGQFTVQAVLNSSGIVGLSSDAGIATQAYNAAIGISAANGLPTTSSDLSTGPTSTVAALYEEFPVGAPDLVGGTTSLFPAGTGYVAAGTCSSAKHTAYGAGCYTLRASFYEAFDFVVPDLSGSGMTLLFTGAAYTALPALVSYLPPSAGATVLALGNDTDTPVTLTGTLNYPGGSTSTLTVCSNGFISAGPNNGTGSFPDVFEHLNSTDACWRAWYDYDVTSPGSGQVKFEQIGSIAYITWDGVHEFGSTTQNTFQMQFDTASGAVHMLWPNLAGTLTYLFGFSPGGSRADSALDISAALPGTFVVAPVDSEGISLSASPAPISTSTTGTAVVYAIDTIPEFAPGSSLYVALNVFSLGQLPAPGLDLTFLGAPGCSALVQSIDFTQSVVGFTPSLTTTLNLPAGVPAGTVIYVQAAALVTPNSLPNGQNASGIVTSNGIASLVQPY